VTLSAAVGSLDAMQRLVEALQDSQLAHSALQVRASGTTPPFVDILFEGSSAGVEAQVGQARTLAGAARLEPAAPTVWQARQALWDAPGPIVKVSVLMSELAGTFQTIQKLADSAKRDWTAVFQATGIGWVRLGGSSAGWPDLLTSLRAEIAKKSGTATVARPASVDDEVESWADAGDAQPLMRAVKQQFDPKGTLNPGRFVGGI